MNDLISRQAAIREYQEVCKGIKCGECPFLIKVNTEKGSHLITDCKLEAFLHNIPSAQPTLYGYNIEHLELIARVLQKEDLPPERVVEALNDIGRIVAIVRDEFEETLRKAVEKCMT